MTEAGVADQVVRLLDIGDYIVPLALRSVCEVGVPDLLADGPRPVDELAARTGTHAPTLRRFLRALAAKGVFTEDPPGTYGLTAMGTLLRTDHPLSLRDALPRLPADLAAWARADHTLRTGEPAFDHVYGRTYYEHMAADPVHAALFDASVETQNRLLLRTLLRAYDWRSLRTVVDVGGGNGSFLAGVLARHRHMRGTLVDLPHVTASAPRVLSARDVADRSDIVSGSFFDPLPPGADAYILKTILQDWPDPQAVALLRNVRAALPSDGHLLVLEGLLPDDSSDHVGKRMALHSQVLAGGHDRTRPEFTELFAEAGLEIASVTHTDMLSILDVRQTARPARQSC